MTDQRALANALAFAGAGFPVFSVWRADEQGRCPCPKGADCTSPGKHPIPINGFHAGTTDPDAVTKMLSASGSGGNYGVVPAYGHIVIDVDGDGWVEKLRKLGLPKTLSVETANGVHLYFHWPAEYGPVPSTLFGWLVRSETHLGYVIGPGSVHPSGKTYTIARQNGHSTTDMLAGIMPFPREHVPAQPAQTSQTSITVGEGMRSPESVPTGSRHAYLRDRARTLRGGGLTGQALEDAMLSINARLPEPKSLEEVRQAIGDVETKYGEDPVPISAEEAVSQAQAESPLIVSIADYRAAQPTNVEWVSPLAAYGHVTMVSGPPKSGKSTLVSGLMRAREANSPFLWGDPVPKGPMLLVTEESGFPVVRKTDGLVSLDILDRTKFVMAGLSKLDHLLAAMSGWADPERPALVIIDTLAVWGDIKDENDAVAATRAIVAIRVWADAFHAAVILVHHARKGGGEHGESIRGSGGIYAAVDQSIELGYTNDTGSDDRRLAISGRLDFPQTRPLVFDRSSMSYDIDMTPQEDDYRLDQFPMDGMGQPGLRTADAEELWGVSHATANKRLKLLVGQRRLVRRDVRDVGKPVAHGEYWKSRPLLVVDARPKGEQLADLIKGRVDD
jgi:hypothetical protein